MMQIYSMRINLQDFSFNLSLNNKQLKRESDCIKYLGILIDSHLSWKPQVDFVVKKIRRSIGILSNNYSAKAK